MSNLQNPGAHVKGSKESNPGFAEEVVMPIATGVGVEWSVLWEASLRQRTHELLQCGVSSKRSTEITNALPVV